MTLSRLLLERARESVDLPRFDWHETSLQLCWLHETQMNCERWRMG